MCFKERKFFCVCYSQFVEVKNGIFMQLDYVMSSFAVGIFARSVLFWGYWNKSAV